MDRRNRVFFDVNVRKRFTFCHFLNERVWITGRRTVSAAFFISYHVAAQLSTKLCLKIGRFCPRIYHSGSVRCGSSESNINHD